MSETYILIGCNREYQCTENDPQTERLCPDLEPEKILLPEDWSLLAFIDRLDQEQPLSVCHLGYSRFRTTTELPDWQHSF